jgi:fluoride ion exporter CrcB/FEX
MRANVTLTKRQLVAAIASVAIGGATGTLLRVLLLRIQDQHWFESLVDAGSSSGSPLWWRQIPWVLLLINCVGVYIATKVLVGPLRAHDPNDPTRLLVITGFFGGLTSYSGLFVSLAAIWHLSVPASVGVTLVALLTAVAAGWLGMRRQAR